MARETWVQSQVKSYQRLKKWYLMPPGLTLSIIRYGSRVKWSNPGKGIVPTPTPWCRGGALSKKGLRITLDYGCQQLESVRKLSVFDWYHHHHVVPLAQISLTLSRHFSLSFIASGESSGLHPVSSHSCCMYVRAGRPAFAWPYVGVHRSTSLMSSSLLLPAVSCMSDSSSLDSFRDGRQVAV